MKSPETDILAPKPVHPRAIQQHGLFGNAFVRQHMVVDERWTPDSITHQFTRMAGLLKKHAQFNSLDKKVRQGELTKKCHNLQKQCRDGRSLLKRLRSGCPQEVRNILKDNRQMQRMYQKMPLHMAEENINQRTFLMRKERDRLQSRLKQLESFYEEKFLAKGDLENRLRYENEFKLIEEGKIIDLMKEVENSKMRLKANMTINSTYKKIIQILQHDETFYVPILRSLDKDVEDQNQFIKHILYLGTPVITRFQELKDQYKAHEDNLRRQSRQSVKDISNYNKILPSGTVKDPKVPQNRGVIFKVRSYVRETRTMLDLKAKFEEVEATIKKIQIATICSNEKDIYPRIKSQVKNNIYLGSQIEDNMLGHSVLDTKMKGASLMHDVLVNNLAEDEIMRLEKIRKLKEDIKLEDEIEADTLSRIKNLANVFVLLRSSLWNLHDIMRNVGPRQIPQIEYPNDHLKLPLLQYEMLSMRAYPPIIFEQNVMKLLRDVYSKLRRLTKDFDWQLDETSIADLQKEFCQDMIGLTMHIDSMAAQDGRFGIDMEPEVDLMAESKLYKNVPNRNEIKVLSARLVEKYMKRDE